MKILEDQVSDLLRIGELLKKYQSGYTWTMELQTPDELMHRFVNTPSIYAEFTGTAKDERALTLRVNFWRDSVEYVMRYADNEVKFTRDKKPLTEYELLHMIGLLFA